MAGLAIFGLKYPSLLKFEKERKENEPLIGNLERLYNIDKTPCDTQLRERLDVVDPSVIRKAFNIIIAKTQRDKVLEDFKFMGKYLLSIDGTGYFHSKDVFCENCCEKKDKEGNIVSYHHNLLAGSIVHPDLKTVIPIAPEPIVKQDGVDKNDCELNAAKRLLPKIKTEHPHLKIIIVADALSANAPYVNLCKENNFNFIVVVKESDHKHLFETFRNANCKMHSMVLENGNIGEFSYINDVALGSSIFLIQPALGVICTNHFSMPAFLLKPLSNSSISFLLSFTPCSYTLLITSTSGLLLAHLIVLAKPTTTLSSDRISPDQCFSKELKVRSMGLYLL